MALNHVPHGFLINGVVAVQQPLAETDSARRIEAAKRPALSHKSI